ncbi:hypothetical protein COO59_16285 [Mixta theicola]|uniref:Uncharacterized protein n=1 Tax=Mixta theicola TaxID=1458355 RepID=A0A2K1Q6K0_9GAMM|nr:hypothetical protein COO59_16285 [Mixta theicola]
MKNIIYIHTTSPGLSATGRDKTLHRSRFFRLHFPFFNRLIFNIFYMELHIIKFLQTQSHAETVFLFHNKHN